MSTDAIVNVLEQLEKFKNEKGYIEIITRDKNKRIKEYFNIVLDGKPQSESKELIENAFKAINKNNNLLEANINKLGNVAKLQNIGLLMNGLNLCATCAGFAIMCKKLDSMSEEITEKIDQLKLTVEAINDAEKKFEYEKVLSEHIYMVDCRRKKKAFSEEQMRSLVSDEYNTINYLVDLLKKNVVANRKEIIIAALSLLSMFTQSLKYFDEIYYSNNYAVLGDNAWFMDHDRWMMVYNNLCETCFVEILQDYAIFDLELNTPLADVFYKSTIENIKSLKQDVEDNQKLIEIVKDPELMQSVRDYTDKEIKDTIEAAFKKVFPEAIDPEARGVLNEAMKQAEAFF